MQLLSAVLCAISYILFLPFKTSGDRTVISQMNRTKKGDVPSEPNLCGI